MSFFKFITTKMFHTQRAEEVMENLLRNEMIYQLKQDNSLFVQTRSGQCYESKAITMDRKVGSLIISEKTPNGLLMLDKDDTVIVMTQVNEQHEVYSFQSKVNNIILDESEILYEIIIPHRLEKGQRRKDYRVDIDTSSQVTMEKSVYTGQVGNISSHGVLFTLDGYWPEPVDEGDCLANCNIEMDFMCFSCNIEVRYINFEPYPARKTYIGGRINSLAPHLQHQLDGYITSRQRIKQRQKAELKYDDIS